MNSTLAKRAAAVLAALALVLALVSPASAVAALATDGTAATTEGPITLTGFTAAADVYRPGDKPSFGWSTSGTPVRYVVIRWEGPGQDNYAAQWFGMYDETGSHAGIATGYATDFYRLPGLYRATSIGLSSPQGGVTYYRDGTVRRGTEIVPDEHHDFDFETLSFHFENPEIASIPFDAAPSPSIQGTPTEGYRLAVNMTGWTPAPTVLRYQWMRDGASIRNANSSYYNLQTEDVGRTLSVRVEAWAGGRAQTFVTSDPTPTIQGRVALGAITISGTTATGGATGSVGSELTAVPAIAGENVTLSYQWYRHWSSYPGSLPGTPIEGATSASYTPTPFDRYLQVKVTGSHPQLQPRTAYSPLIAIGFGTIAGAPLQVTGTPRVGSPLTAVHNTWSPVQSISYQWERSGTAIAVANTKTYVPTAADIGAQLTLRITARTPGYVDRTETFRPSGSVAPGIFSAAPVPTVTGTRKVGSVLTANPGIWGPAPLALRYQWFRSGVAVTGATAKGYVLTSADMNKLIAVRVTGVKEGYSSLTKASAATTAIAAGTLVAPVPTVTGTKRVGYMLTANPGTWTAGTTLRYQWYRSGAAIAGATGKTYRLVTADRYDTMRVRIVGTKPGYLTLTKYSSSTTRVI